MDAILEVAVVIPAHNREVELRRALASVRNQSSPPAEVIVVDDASTDGTVAVAEEFDAHVIRLERNGGAARARNAGAKAARSEWLAFLDSDDEWSHNHLTALEPAAEAGFLACASAATREGGGSLAGRVHGSPNRSGEVVRTPARLLFPENPVPLSASLVHRELFEHVGGFREDLRYAEDFDFWLRVASVAAIRLVPDVSAVYHLHGGQKSNARAARRSVQDSIVASFADAYWYDQHVAARYATVTTWDDVRRELRSEEYLSAAKSFARLITSPAQVRWLLPLWRFRYRLRRLSAQVSST